MSCIGFCTISYCMVQYAALPYAWCFILRSCSVCLCTCASRYRYGIVLTWRHLVFLLSGAVCTCASFLYAYWYVHTCIRSHIYAFCIYLGACMVQVCPCMMCLSRLGMAAILAFAFEALMCEFAGVVCTAFHVVTSGIVMWCIDFCAILNCMV